MYDNRELVRKNLSAALREAANVRGAIQQLYGSSAGQRDLDQINAALAILDRLALLFSGKPEFRPTRSHESSER